MCNITPGNEGPITNEHLKSGDGHEKIISMYSYDFLFFDFFSGARPRPPEIKQYTIEEWQTGRVKLDGGDAHSEVAFTVVFIWNTFSSTSEFFLWVGNQAKDLTSNLFKCAAKSGCVFVVRGERVPIRMELSEKEYELKPEESYDIYS
jgi:hypothetical protein